MLLPFQATVVSQYLTLSALGLLDTRAAIILPCAFGAFGAFLLTQFMRGLDPEILEAARLDGASTFQLLTRIVIPMVRPGMITVAVLIILNAWNEYLISSTFLQGEENFTVTLGYLTLNGASVTFDQGMKMAGALMIIVPILIFFLSLQRYFVDGLANGSLKE